MRAQTASVASTTSSTSDLFSSQIDYPSSYAFQSTGGASIIPTSARRHRSSSNLSQRSSRSARDGTANAVRDTVTTSVSGVAAPRDSYSHQPSSRPSLEISRPEISRQNSMTGAGYRSASATSPYLSQHGTTSYGHGHRTSVGSTSNPSYGQSQEARSPSFSSAIAAARYEEAALHRAELDAVKKENDSLRQRIRDLERVLSQANTSNEPLATISTDNTDT